ncbi:MAG: hypothetical protein FWD49_00895 [Firmicutes bacterium]|nr:hypothetical protein [Bacillota bacterium]
MTDNQKYASSIFFKSAIPLLKVVATDTPLGLKLKGKSFVLQLSAIDEGVKYATHFVIESGEFKTVLSVHESPDIELSFPNIDHFVNFMAGKTMKLPKIKGAMKNFGAFISVMRLLLKMASLLQAKDLPKKEADRVLLVKLYFYLLSGGISQLNKAGHPEVKEWAQKSPDRVYAFAVNGMPEVSAWVRVKAGNSKAGRGEYERCMPFFRMRFDSIESALNILLQKADMLSYTAESKLIMDGAPEFGGQLGQFMMIIAGFAK